ncbi:carbohydrate ABC transporter ATP-binding protein, CUT1 family [Faunimonas pinastri]|uniref:Carbohydrate ABC transporter ATP-binding protein, CUT1 family n=1 Tax=Faunimonas pinastri TaxID=1855383 RepID=A0A1H9EGZ6_9HYPH|nr:ABC transporter ATP-binding protein [Faunimonas pinastri]SEQ25036.1 carbohydrate ABC transporter ATP-binding protein, CUT1 family [Faunimonas pinastri]
MGGIQIEHVRKSYGSLEVLKDFSLDVSDGEFVVFVGPSGCGKSTMLKILAGLDAATSGRVLIGGREVTDLAPGDRDIAMVFQNYALYPHLTVARNMGFGLKMRGTPKAEIERRVADAARILGVEHLLERRPKALSGGQRQRVALGRAIVRQPAAFLMDEPLSNLDAKLRVHMRVEIGALHQRLGVTTIYVTHDQIEAMTMADRIVIMRDGAIQQVADPDTMFRRPANLFVAGFIGSPGMNIIRAPLTGTAGSAEVQIFGQRVTLPVPGEHLARLKNPWVLVGLRPEHFQLGPGAVTFETPARMVESLGSEKYLYLEVPEANRLVRPDQPGAGTIVATAEKTNTSEADRGATIIARLINPGQIAQDNAVRLSFDPANLHVFDPETERAITA